MRATISSRATRRRKAHPRPVRSSLTPRAPPERSGGVFCRTCRSRRPSASSSRQLKRSAKCLFRNSLPSRAAARLRVFSQHPCTQGVYGSDPLPVPEVPEPATWALLLLGFGAIGGMTSATRRREASPQLRLTLNCSQVRAQGSAPVERTNGAPSQIAPLAPLLADMRLAPCRSFRLSHAIPCKEPAGRSLPAAFSWAGVAVARHIRRLALTRLG